MLRSPALLKEATDKERITKKKTIMSTTTMVVVVVAAVVMVMITVKKGKTSSCVITGLGSSTLYQKQNRPKQL